VPDQATIGKLVATSNPPHDPAGHLVLLFRAGRHILSFCTQTGREDVTTRELGQEPTKKKKDDSMANDNDDNSDSSSSDDANIVSTRSTTTTPTAITRAKAKYFLLKALASIQQPMFHLLTFPSYFKQHLRNVELACAHYYPFMTGMCMCCAGHCVVLLCAGAVCCAVSVLLAP
jgi:hypothetical protein